MAFQTMRGNLLLPDFFCSAKMLAPWCTLDNEGAGLNMEGKQSQQLHITTGAYTVNNLFVRWS